ncbi:asparaginase domain-containing protein [Chitiniphilus eburneus]|uniref:asparaginase domain-containing protein n=1 Tax=Chitiniphilus eburneus TaxID=2571148 RepID=UPI0035D04E90
MVIGLEIEVNRDCNQPASKTTRHAVRILIIYTGGTIGMAPGPHGLAPLAGGLAVPLATHCPGAEVLEYSPLLDSSSMTPRHWLRIAQDIRTHADIFDGFLILHGTDTLAWTAAALAYQLQDLPHPVIVTGAMHPWHHVGGDAMGNIAAAWAFLQGPACPGVGVVFADALYRGVRVRKLDCESAAAFGSPNAPGLGVFRAGMWQLDTARLDVPAIPRPQSKPLRPQTDILSLRLAPGFNAEWFADQLATAPPQGLLLEAYGSGNLPEHPGLLAVLGDLAARIPVAVCTQCLRGSVRLGLYAAGGPLAAAGAFDAGDMTPEASLAKLYWVMAQAEDLAARRALFEAPLLGDRSA